jgi:ATP-dependent DNA helicase RecG
LNNLGIISKFDHEFRPTVAGYLLFSKKDPLSRYPFERYTIRCVKYSGNNTSSDIIDKLDIKGTLDNQIDESYKFILKNIRKMAFIEGTKRVEKYEYPEEAIRELIANAIIHRDYKIIETYPQINIFENRIEIKNPGCLPPGVTIDNIKEAQFSRNPIIAARLKDLDYLEEYGRGIDIVFDKMHQWNLQPPLFRNTINSFEVTLLGHKFSSLNERQIKIINSLLIKGSINIRACMKVLKGVPRATINKDLKDMRFLKIIEPFGTSINIFYKLSF